MKTFAEVHDVLRHFWPDQLTRPNTYTLETITALMDYLGNPQNKLKVIHVAGTSGKSSTTYYAAALLAAAGKKVGHTVSPHVDEINERVQINGMPMPEHEFCRELTTFLDLVKGSGLRPSYFEIMIAFAFWEFTQVGMEYAVIEVGLGGLTDATNIIDRPDKVCVITDIGLDHTDRLGPTLESIAEQKAGIIQPGNSVFCYQQDEEAAVPIRERARQQGADLQVLGVDAAVAELDDLPLFQQRNLGLARAAVDHCLQQNGGVALTKAMVAQAAKAYIPARMEEVQYGGRTIVIDAAHNGQKLHAMAESLRHKYPGQKVAGVVGFVAKRSFRLEDSAEEVARLLDHVIATSFHGAEDEVHDSEDPNEVVELLRRHGVASLEVAADPEEALKTLLARPEPILMITGSFYLLNCIRPLLREKA